MFSALPFLHPVLFSPPPAFINRELCLVLCLLQVPVLVPVVSDSPLHCSSCSSPELRVLPSSLRSASQPGPAASGPGSAPPVRVLVRVEQTRAEVSRDDPSRCDTDRGGAENHGTTEEEDEEEEEEEVMV